jgi:(R,R)-butanediol dehydrogenase/meso-butanediol dehydrogenase/diacetyl reductase
MGLIGSGFFAEAIALRPRNLVPVPDSLSYKEAAIVEPAALAPRVLDAVKSNMSAWVTIIGQGAIGLLIMQVARLKGCRIIAVDLKDYRLRLAEKYGAEFCINAGREDAVKRVRDTKYGSDVVVKAAATRATVEQTPFMVRKAGKVVFIGESKEYLNLEDADEAVFFYDVHFSFGVPFGCGVDDQKNCGR